MRAVLSAVVILLALPASAGAQSAGSLTVTGTGGPGADAMERTLTVTVTNEGPGALTKGTVSLVVRLTPHLLAYTDVGGCQGGFADPALAICMIAVPLAEGEQRSFTLRVRFTGTVGYDRDQATLKLTHVDEGSLVATETVTVDLGVAAPAAEILLDLPEISPHYEHGRPHTIVIYAVVLHQNVSDVQIAHNCRGPVRVTRPPDGVLRPSPSITRDFRPRGIGEDAVKIECDWTPPAHRKGERPVDLTATATGVAADGRPVRATVTHRVWLTERVRACGTMRLRAGGRQRSFKVQSTAPDRSCAGVKRQLEACRKTGRAPAGFRCVARSRRIVLSRLPGAAPAVMVASR